MTDTDGWVSACESAHCIRVRFNKDGSVDLGHGNDSYLTFSMQEWDTFTEAVVEGEFEQGF